MYSKVVVTIGGSDSGGGAGVQADLKTFMALKLHGCSVITCVTAQNSLGVDGIQDIKADLISSQIQCLFNDFQINALKTGMLLNKCIIETIAENIRKYTIPKIIDPVMVSRSGSKLLENDAIDAYVELLFPQAEIITPNIYEANLLTNIDIKNKEDIEHAGEVILDLGVKSVLIKGGGIRDLSGKDFFIDNKGNKKWLCHKFIQTQNTHGSGCTLSAAICGYRALEFKTMDSIKQSKVFVEKSLDNSYQIGSGPGPLGHY